jgi:hypothetical protein
LKAFSQVDDSAQLHESYYFRLTTETVKDVPRVRRIRIAYQKYLRKSTYVSDVFFPVKSILFLLIFDTNKDNVISVDYLEESD